MPGNSRAALIYIDGGAPPIMGTVIDISEGGMGLTVVDAAKIPDSFKLQIKGETKIHSCKIAWKKEPHWLGVAFEPEATV